MKSFDKVFLTGCDANTEWMLPWFTRNYMKYNQTPLIFANFGVSEEALNRLSPSCIGIIDLTHLPDKGWFKKPFAMIEASRSANKVCWLDTDCEVMGKLDDIFNYIEPNKLAMADDKPWSTRRGEPWLNSGVVAFEGRPPILEQWAKDVRANPTIGDQEVLHSILNVGLRRQIYTSTLPSEYNWLRLMLQDGFDSNKKKIVHWTGPVGKQHIRGIINGQ